MLLAYFAVLLAIAAGSVAGLCICLYKLCKENTAYSRLKDRVDGHFKNSSLTPTSIAQGSEPLQEILETPDAQKV
jgi:hypothetical protein